MLLNVCDSVVSSYANEYQKTTGKILPTRGNIHDLSGAITHKREKIAPPLRFATGDYSVVLTRLFNADDSKENKAFQRSCRRKVSVALTPRRYIRDYESVKIVQKATEDIDEISQITHLSKRVIQQYLDLIPDDDFQSLEPKN